MQFVFTFIFILLFAMFLYGYFSFYNIKKHLPKCNVIYILDDGMGDSSHPDFHQTRSNELSNLEHKNRNK